VAKKKPRTPTPPRPVQAPQRRTTQRGDDLGRQHRNALYAISAGGIVALVAVVIGIVAFGSNNHNRVNDRQVASLMSTAGCTFKTVDAYVPQGQTTHVNSLTAKLPWNTDPPSNGQHYPIWAVWGFYTQPVNPRQVVHNEEHGGVILWWGPRVPQSTVAKLRQLYDQQSTAVFGTPYPNLGSKVAITAWTGDTSRYQRNGYYGQGHIGICPSYTAATVQAFTAFRNAYRGKGPEGVPMCDDVAGDGPSRSSC
jgi:hypothetical protein